jgi:hypothetical protein
MFVTYAPEDPSDGDRQEWTFKPGRVRASEAQVLQRQFGENWDAFALGVQSGDIHARRVLLWHLLRLEHPTLAFKDVPDFFTEELTVEFDSAELVPMRERAEKAGLPEEKRQQVLAALDLALTEAMEREAGAGKAP